MPDKSCMTFCDGLCKILQDLSSKTSPDTLCDLACKNVQDHGRKILHNLSDKILEFTMNKIYLARSGLI